MAELAQAICVCARAWASVYIIGILTKTFLIYMNKVPLDSFKDWFKFRSKGDRL